jgi:hypothetical protein
MVSKEKLKEEILLGYGILARVARNLNVGIASIYRWINKYDLKEFVTEARTLIDDAALDSALNGAIDDPNVAIKLLSVRKVTGNGFKLNVDKEGGIEIIVKSEDEKNDLDKFLE